MERLCNNASGGFTNPGASFSGLSNALLNCDEISDIRSMGPLPDEAQRLIDDQVIGVGLDRLVFVADLMAAGLVFPIPDPLGTMELFWEKENKQGFASRTMLPTANTENVGVEREGVRVPVYATLEKFHVNIRYLRAFQRHGQPLDTSMVSQAMRRVNEAIEDAGVNGAGFTIAGSTTPGLIDAPNRATQAYSGSNPAWDDAAKTGEEILTDVKNMIDLLHANRKFGPYNLYIPTTYDNAINLDFKSNSDKSIRFRLEELSSGGRNIRVRACDVLPANRTALVQMTDDVVDVAIGQEPLPLSWTDGPGWEIMFAILAFMIPRVKDTQDNKSGICIGNTS